MNGIQTREIVLNILLLTLKIKCYLHAYSEPVSVQSIGGYKKMKQTYSSALTKYNPCVRTHWWVVIVKASLAIYKFRIKVLKFVNDVLCQRSPRPPSGSIAC